VRAGQQLRAIPAVEKVLQALGPVELPRPLVVATVRQELATLRTEKKIPHVEAVLARIRTALNALRHSRLQPVINGTGVLIHTNLGRAPLGEEVVHTLATLAANYNNLEFDLTSGERGSRAAYLEATLALLCGAESATVVNNCAAALTLILRHFTGGARKEVVISRGELIQIGGGFRIPEILESSGARLREVGTTNKTALSDYARAIGRNTALILKVHRSNFFMGGFVASPATAELAALAKKHRVPLIEDLGSGAMFPTEQLADIEHESMPVEVLEHGVDLVCCSGDKLLGGPQAGIIAGRARLVAALKREPFFRALRCDKLILGALQATADLYLSGGAVEKVPVLALLHQPLDQLRRRADILVESLAGMPVEARVSEGRAQVGGGTLPRTELPSVAVELLPKEISVQEFATRLRTATTPVIGCISAGRVTLDLRTIFLRQEEALLHSIREALTGARS
jgi:L-seryl-tRNA(Ser) seleniumtransferase